MTSILRPIRLCAAMLLAASVFGAGAAAAQTPSATSQARKSAYEAAMKCFVANAHAIGSRERAGDATKAAYYESKARQSFDTAVKLGGVLGYSGSRIDQDFALAETRELLPMLQDEAYFLSIAATCKALGLM